MSPLSAVTDLELAKLCQATYSSPASLPVPATGVYACITEMVDGIIVAFRGSVTTEDWARDFLTIPIDCTEHPQIGLCHAGFLAAAMSIVEPVLNAARGRQVILTGHSLGGADAVGVGGLMVCLDQPPLRIATFGAPRFGMDKFVTTLIQVPIHQYRRGNDIVPQVPFDVPPLIRFLDTRLPLIQIGVAQRDRFKCHAIAGYIADIETYNKKMAA